MNKEKVGLTINRYTDVISDAECDALFNFVKNKTNNPVEDSTKVPWDEKNNNVIYFAMIENQEIRDIIIKYKNKIAEDLSEEFNEKIYPHLTTLVLWKPGQQMPRHVDDGNGYPEREQELGMRFAASVTYINDDYEGGHTFVKNDGVNDHSWRGNSLLSFPNDQFEDYISVPEKGATISFLSDDSNAHGVTEVEKSDRVILSTWFTKNDQYRERDDFILNQQQVQESKASQQTQSVQNWNK